MNKYENLIEDINAISSFKFQKIDENKLVSNTFDFIVELKLEYYEEENLDEDDEEYYLATFELINDVVNNKVYVNMAINEKTPYEELIYKLDECIINRNQILPPSTDKMHFGVNWWIDPEHTSEQYFIQHLDIKHRENIPNYKKLMESINTVTELEFELIEHERYPKYITKKDDYEIHIDFNLQNSSKLKIEENDNNKYIFIKLNDEGYDILVEKPEIFYNLINKNEENIKKYNSRKIKIVFENGEYTVPNFNILYCNNKDVTGQYSHDVFIH